MWLSRQLFRAARALENETGLPALSSYDCSARGAKEMIFFQSLLLDGRWEKLCHLVNVRDTLPEFYFFFSILLICFTSTYRVIHASKSQAMYSDSGKDCHQVKLSLNRNPHRIVDFINLIFLSRRYCFLFGINN